MRKGYVSFKKTRKSTTLPELKEVKPRWHPPKGFYRELTQEFWDGDRLKDGIGNLPKLEPSKLNSELLWDSYDQMERYPERFERWMLEEADLFGSIVDHDSDEIDDTEEIHPNQSEVKKGNEAQALFPLIEKKNVKPPEQLSLFR